MSSIGQGKRTTDAAAPTTKKAHEIYLWEDMAMTALCPKAAVGVVKS